MEYKHKEIRDAVNYALELAREHNGSEFTFSNDAINWGDLSCVDVEFVVYENGHEFYRIQIEEADPGSQNLNNWVEKHLRELGIKDELEINIEW